MVGLRRRDFITLVGCAAAWPGAARAQRTERTRRIAVLMAVSERDDNGQDRIAVLRQALRELGWSEDHNLKIDVRWTAGDSILVRNYT
jgi:putative ABC transport system substrate-binding protein